MEPVFQTFFLYSEGDPGMNPFKTVLTKLQNRLELPQPEKSRILLEIAGDLDDLYQYYKDQGIEEEKAIQRVLEKIDLSDENLKELIHIHQPRLKGWMDRLSEQAQTRWERIILVSIFLIVIIACGRVIVTTPFFIHASPFIWPVLGSGVFSIILALWKIYHLYIRKNHSIRNIRKGLSLIFYLGLFNIIFGVTGYYIELLNAGDRSFILGSRLFFLITEMSPRFQETLDYIIWWYTRTAAMVMTSLVASMISGILWYLLHNKVTQIEQYEAMLLLKK
jgi:hypothetical protein